MMVGGSDNVKVEQSDRSMVEPMVVVTVGPWADLKADLMADWMAELVRLWAGLKVVWKAETMVAVLVDL